MTKQPTVHVYLNHSESYVRGNVQWYKRPEETVYSRWSLNVSFLYLLPFGHQIY